MTSRDGDLITFIGQAACLLIEEVSADAVVICVTRQRKGQTETYVRPFGNIHACRGIVEYAYDQMLGEDEEEEQPEETEGTEDADDD